MKYLKREQMKQDALDLIKEGKRNLRRLKRIQNL
jgi:hypothetical protein